MMHINILHLAVIAGPLLARSVAHHVYHRVCHALIHHAGHRVSFIGRTLSRFKFATDAILVCCLAVFGSVTEHEEHHSSEPDRHE
jgi:class 3 adenylate cyclase